jgi:hypothetical protein
VLPAFVGAANARAHDAAPLPLWNAGQATHHAGASRWLRRNGRFTSICDIQSPRDQYPRRVWAIIISQ